MDLTSHISNAYDSFYSYRFSSSLILSLMKISLVTSLAMLVLGLGSPPARAFLHFLKYPLIVLVDFHVMESPITFVVSVENFQFPAQKLLRFQVQNSDYNYCMLSFRSLFQNRA